MYKKLISSLAMVFAMCLVSPSASFASSGGLTPEILANEGALTGEVDLTFKVDNPKYGSFDFLCLTLDGKPILDEDNLFIFTTVKSPGFAPSESYDFTYSNDPKPKEGCINEYGFSSSSEQYSLTVLSFRTGALVNGPHALSIEGFYGDGSTVSGTLNFESRNATKLELDWDSSLVASQPYGSSLVIGGTFGRSSELPPLKADVRVIQKSGTSKWSTVTVIGGKFFFKKLKIASPTTIQVRTFIAGETRLFSSLVNVKPSIRVLISNLYVGKRSVTKIITTGMKTGMCQLNVDTGYSYYRPYPMPIKNGVASIGFTFNSTGQYSGSVSCTGRGFVPGTVEFAQQISLG